MPGRSRRAESADAVVKPAGDGLDAERKSLNRVSTDFLKIDVATALTFAAIALQTDDSAKKRRNQRAARKAYDTVLKYLKKVKLTEDDAQTLSGNLERLKSELKALGEVF